MVGALLIKLDRLGVAVLSGSTSLAATTLLFQVWLSNQQISTIFTLVLSALSIGCFCLGFMWPQISIVITTSFLGSYALVRGVSFFIGSFPAELLIIKVINGKRPKSINS
jgi:uncharacterized membrane protein HdeD (DUF308 family)